MKVKIKNITKSVVKISMTYEEASKLRGLFNNVHINHLDSLFNNIYQELDNQGVIYDTEIYDKSCEIIK